MRLTDLNAVLYYLHGKLSAVILDAPDGSGERLAVGMNFPDSISYPDLPPPYVRVVTPHWHNPSDPKPNHFLDNYIGSPADLEALTVQPTIDATNHGHGSFTISNGEVVVV